VPKLKKVFVLSNGGTIHWHDSMAKGSLIMQDFGAGINPDKHPFEVYITESPADITAAHLIGVQCLVMNNVSGIGQLLNKAQKDVVEAFVASGGGTVAWHSTMESYGTVTWPWFYNWISANYIGVAARMPARMTRSQVSRDLQYTSILENTTDAFEIGQDEWMMYNNPRPEDNPYNRVLLSVDPKSINSTEASLPVIWVNESQKGGRFWGTGLGHYDISLARADVQEMIYRGVVWTGGGWDLAGCLSKNDANYNPAATLACTNCCTGMPILIKTGTEARSREIAFSNSLTEDFSVAVNEMGKHSPHAVRIPRNTQGWDLHRTSCHIQNYGYKKSPASLVNYLPYYYLYILYNSRVI
jgi:type 1 glutamine amidotransferase